MPGVTKNALASAVFAVACQTTSVGVAPRGSASAVATTVTRTPAELRREGNHLVGAASAYLRQHSHNPVDWYSWGPEALALAVKLDRPIFLSIGYVSCHWCHVMEKEVFERDDVANFLNEHFISIKVDREERPDLDAVYMDAVETLTGSGGWPMTLFLTPSLRPFFGGTYLPHENFLQAIRSGEEEFRTARSDAESRGAEVSTRIREENPSEPASPFSAEELHDLARRSLASVDPSSGGFRGRTKFPTPIKWRFLLDAYRKWGDRELEDAIRKTLDAMAAGGIHDHVGGGFFRYSTEPTWTIPHFEKMLYDNAQLATLYLTAAAAFDEPRYGGIGLDTLEFLLRDMRAPEGGFGASFDADTEGKEGATYLFTPTDLQTALGDQSTAAGTFLGITASGNFEGSNIPTRRVAGAFDAASEKRWSLWRPRLLAARQRRAQPSFDAKMVTAWNGLVIGALSVGYRASGERRFLDAAKETTAAIWKLNRSAAGELLRASDGARAGDAAVLDDYAFLGSGLVDLFEATSEPVYLQQAIALSGDAISRFSNPVGGWFLTSGTAQEPLGRRLALDDGVEPSGNAAMILLLERLAALTGNTDLPEVVHRALYRYGALVRQRGLDMAGWLDGALLDAGPFYEVIVAGNPKSLGAVQDRLLPAWAVGARIPAKGAAAALTSVMPTASEKLARGDVALAYVCVRGSCKAPTSDPAKLREQVLAGWTH